MTNSLLDRVRSVSTPVAPEERRRYFDDFSNDTSTQIRKVEGLPTYAEPDDESYMAWVEGRSLVSGQLVQERIRVYDDYYRELSDRGVTFSRIRLVDPQFSSYLVYELFAYVEAARWERLFFVPTDSLSTEQSRDVADMLVFDDRHALVNEYSETGYELTEVWATSNQEVVAALVGSWESLRSQAIPFDQLKLDWDVRLHRT